MINIDNDGEASKKYRSRRLVEGYLFLKSLSSNEFSSENVVRYIFCTVFQC